MKKVVLRLDLQDEKAKQKVMKIVSALSGVESIFMDMKEKKLTVLGDIDPVHVVSKLRKLYPTEIVSVGPAKEEKKKEEAKKDNNKDKKKDKKDDNKDNKKDNKDDNKGSNSKDDASELVKLYKNYNPYMTTHYYVRSAEEDPNSCVIC